MILRGLHSVHRIDSMVPEVWSTSPSLDGQCKDETGMNEDYFLSLHVSLMIIFAFPMTCPHI